MNSFRLWMHGFAAAAAGGAITALTDLLLQPADLHFDPASLHRYATAAAGGAAIAVLAYFKQSPIQSHVDSGNSTRTGALPKPR